MRRILLLITDLKIGGTPTVVRELALRLRDPGRVEIEVACLSEWGPVASELHDAGVTVTALGARSAANFPRTLVRLVQLIRRGGFDTVFSFLVHANAIAAAASPLFPAVRFLQSIQTTQPNPAWHWWLQRAVQVGAEKVVVPSESVAEIAIGQAGVARERLAVIPNAVDIQSFGSIYAANAARLAHRPRRVGFIGRLDPIKRIPELVAAMPHLPGCRLDIYGEGSDRPQIEESIRRLTLDDRVTLHGAISRPHDALATMDVLVLPSRAEGFGLVLIEAMAAGVPVVGASAPGIRDVIQPVQTGFLLHDMHWTSFFVAIMDATSDVFRKALVPAARADVEQRFAWPAVLERYRRLLGIIA